MKKSIKSLSKLSIATLSLLVGIQVFTTPANAMIQHKVQKDENLYRVAKNYHTDVETLVADNNLSNLSLKTGQVLKISNYVQVRKGDTLKSIAKANQLDANKLKEVNHLKSDKIKAGQLIELYQPIGEVSIVVNPNSDFILDKNNTWNNGWNNVFTNGFTKQNYMIHSGDDLNYIALLYTTTVSKLKSLNHLTSDKIYIGQIIKVRTDKEQAELEKRLKS